MKEYELTIKEAQRMVDDWITGPGGGYFSELTNMAMLAEETGEVARVIARIYGDQVAKPGDNLDLADELADLLWVAMAIANQTGVDLTEAMRRNVEKKNRRDAHRFESREIRDKSNK